MGNAKADPGFFPVSHPTLPAVLKQHASSVYRIVIQHPRNHVRVTPDTMPFYWAQEVANAPSHKRFWKEAEIEHFFQNGYGRVCNVSMSTAFLVGDNRTLLTTAHDLWNLGLVPNRYFNSTAESGAEFASKRLVLPMVIFDDKGSVVFSSRRTPPASQVPTGMYEVRTLGHPSMIRAKGGLIRDVRGAAGKNLLDFFAIRLDRDLPGHPLPMATSLPQKGERVFSLGFPFETTGRASLGAPDSDGVSLLASVGKVIDFPRYTETLLNADGMTAEVAAAYLDQLVISDLDASFGTSGSPKVNDSGELCALLTTTWDTPEARADKAYGGKTKGLATQFFEEHL